MCSTLKLNSFNVSGVENHWGGLSSSNGAGGSVPARQRISLGWNSVPGSAAQGQHVLVGLQRWLQEVDFGSSLVLHSPFSFFFKQLLEIPFSNMPTGTLETVWYVYIMS